MIERDIYGDGLEAGPEIYHYKLKEGVKIRVAVSSEGWVSESKLKASMDDYCLEHGVWPDVVPLAPKLAVELGMPEDAALRLLDCVEVEEEEGKGEEFVAGDIVGLKSGGPEMTVEGVWPIEGQVICSWFTDGNVQTRMFPAACLFKVEPSHD